ncbi:hypothetical protein HPB48_022430 [Haemaphysalis longicornis]|uniref:Rhabdovirus nucleocapsid domain-containing protein n=1 Tax=Haemaphysalis longicornis TaxID=44386 RepID=A0A9J6H2W5_HAELO|nr:hypothetical protein HPB48_022430 [Haemaphysalis longicornis]
MACSSGSSGASPSVVDDTAPRPVRRPEYPSQWFEAHPGKKPVVRFKKYSASLDVIAQVVDHGLRTKQLKVEHVVPFIYEVGLKISATLDEPWVSFGRRIGGEGEQITPWSLLSIETEDGGSLDAPVVSKAPRSEFGLLGMVVCIYRLVEARKRGTASYEAALQGKITGVLRSAPFGCTDAEWATGASKRFHAWCSDKAYLALIAALDMFFQRFRNHELAVLQVGTCSSRLKACGVLESIDRVCLAVGLTRIECFKWAFFVPLVDELRVIFKEGEELGVAHSYAPYLSDLGLSGRSPYSTTMNPCVHFWCHVANAILGSQRSRNAMVTCYDFLMELTYLAAVFASVNYRHRFRRLVLRGRKEAEEWHRKQVEEEKKRQVYTDVTQEPLSANPEHWFKYLANKDFVVTKDMTTCFQRAAAGCQNARKGSVGEYLKKFVSDEKRTTEDYQLPVVRMIAPELFIQAQQQ